MNRLLILAGLLTLTACGTGGPRGDIATYDALKSARATCQAKGEDLVLRTAGNDQRMSAYECKGKSRP